MNPHVITVLTTIRNMYPIRKIEEPLEIRKYKLENKTYL